MTDILSFLLPPFLVAVCLVGIHTIFGLVVIARRVIFVDLALAQIAALGTTVAFMLGYPAQSIAAYGYSLAFTMLAAVLLALTRLWTGRLPQEALIGIVYVVAAAAAILLVDQAPQGAEHLKQILTGNILTTGMKDLVVIVPLYGIIAAIFWLLRERSDSGSVVWDIAFYAAFGVVVTSSVAIAGVLLVFSFLIIPAAIGVLLARTPRHQLWIAWAAGIVASSIGFATSFALDTPTGATIVCTFGATLAIVGALIPFTRGNQGESIGRALMVSRWVVSGLLLLTGVTWMAAPRMDLPLVDAVEYAVPSVRALYFTRAEANAFNEARQQLERYRREADQLNVRERVNRSEANRFDGERLARISSFLKSYGEMQRGEQFVAEEIVKRARTRIRWTAGTMLLVLAVVVLPLRNLKGWLRQRVGKPPARAGIE